MKKVKKILITGNPFYGNYGTMSLVVAAVRNLWKIRGDVVFYKGSICRDRDIEAYRGTVPEGALRIYGLNGTGIPIGILSPLLLLVSVGPVRECDLVLEIPGEIPSDISLYSQFGRFLLAKVFSKPFVIYSCSLGPFKSPLARGIARFMYGRVDLLLVREPATLKYLRSLGVKGDIKLVADHAFLMAAVESGKVTGVLKGLESFVAASFKSVYYNKFPLYRENVLNLLDYFSRGLGRKVLVIPHSLDDAEVSERLVSDFCSQKNTGEGEVTLLEGNFSPQELKAIIAKSDFFVGSRIHACISAISTKIPTLLFIPRSDYRGVGTMGFFGLTKWVVDPDVQPGRFLEVLKEAYRERGEIRNSISKKLPQVKQLSRLSAEIIKDAFF